MSNFKLVILNNLINSFRRVKGTFGLVKATAAVVRTVSECVEVYNTIIQT